MKTILNPAHPHQVAAPAPRALRVLIADDEMVIAETLCLILRQNRFEATAAYGGREAIEEAKRWRPDIFLTDVVMPEVDGIEAAVVVSDLLPKCRILLFSGQAAVHDLLHEVRLQGHNFELLAKPVHPEELLECLQRPW